MRFPSVLLRDLLFSEITVMVIVGVDDYLLHNDFRVNHDDLQDVLAWGDALEGGIEPTEVVEYLITTGQLSSLPETA